MTLDQLTNEQSAVITSIEGTGEIKKRLMEMGFVRGVIVKMIRKAPMSDPIELEIMGFHLCLRIQEARLINASLA